MDFNYSDALSLLALSISAITFYLVYLKRGKIRMTKPAQIWFGITNDENARPFVFAKSLIYSTSLQGQIIETMYAKITRNESKQIFNIWALGFGSSQSQLGGLKIHNGGVFADNVFISPKDGSNFAFLEGKYEIEIFARTTGEKKNTIKLESMSVEINSNMSGHIGGKSVLQFYLQSDGETYHCSKGEIPRDLNIEFLEKFSQMMTAIETVQEKEKPTS